MKHNYTSSNSLSKNLLELTIKIKNLKENMVFYILGFLFLFVSNAHAQWPGFQNGPNSGSFVVPANVTHVTVGAFGGGGGGGGSDTNDEGGSGGGGGGAATATYTVTAGNTFMYTIGGGGTAGNNNPAGTGGAGGNTTVTSALPFCNIVANGGTGGGPNLGLTGIGGTASGGTTNNNGSNGTLGNTSGQAGGVSGLGLDDVTNLITQQGAGGAAPRTNSDGATGGIPGGGGSGGERGGSRRFGGAGATGELIFNYIVVNSVPATACIGNTITITGDYFLTGAHTVTINGTACTSVTRVNVNTITAVVAPSTTSGQVIVTSPRGMHNGYTITINTPPTITVQPTAPATVCGGSGTRTMTVTATGTTSYQWYKSPGTLLTNGALYSGVNTATLTITNPALTDAGNYYVVVGNAAGCTLNSNNAALSVGSTPTISANPANQTIGAGASTSFSATFANSPTTFIWEVSTDGGTTWSTVTNGGVYSNATTATLNLTSVPFSMNGYRYRSRTSNICGTSANSNVAILTVTICASSGGTFPDGITGVNFNTINNLGTSVNTGYQDFTSLSTTLIKGSSYPLNIYINTGGNYTNYQSVYIDWNGNGSFADAGEFYNLGTATNVTNGLTSLSPLSIPVPLGAISGTILMRVQSRYNAATTGPCQTGFDGETEDYSLQIIDASPCVAPTAQPTALFLSPGGTTIGGSFTAASPVSDNYLVVINTTGIAPTLTNGTSYTIGSGVLGGTNIIVDTDSNTSFVATGLTISTTYYIFVFSYNSLCTGGPIYNTTAPLTGTTTTTTAPSYCTPSVGATFENLTYFTNISFVGSLNDVSNTSTFSSVPRGYEDFSGLPNKARQAQGQGVNISMQTNSRGYVKAWVDWNRDGDFLDVSEEVYSSGGVATYSTSFGFIIPIAQALGDYRIRIRINKDDYVAPYDPNAISTFDSCQNINYYGETEDYTFTVVATCNTFITSVTELETCGPGTVQLTAVGTNSPSEYRWYANEYGGAPLATTATGTWTTPVIAATTTYWVSSYNGCESLVRTKVIAKVNPLATISFTPSLPEVCGENQVLSLTASGDVELTYLIDEKFNSGLGVFGVNNITSNGGAINALTQWQNETSTFVPAQQVWFPAISSGLGGNNFVMATSDVGAYTINTALQSPTVNTNTYLDLFLNFDIFYSRYFIDGTSLPNDYVSIEVSTDGGATWPTEITRYTADIGYGTRFTNIEFDLSAYINNPNFRFRIRYYGVWCDGVAIDNVKLFGNVPLNTSFNWTSALPVDAYQDLACTIPYIPGSPAVTVYVKPNLSQLEQTSYSFTATATLSNGCAVNQTVSVDNKSKVWLGNTDDWSDPNNWLPVGVPDANTCVIIKNATNGSIISGSNVNGFGKTLQVKPGGELNILPTNTLTITDYVDVSVGGTFNLENSSSLIQINNVANTGIISMKRNANIRQQDYVYWSSPVANFSSSAISPGTTNTYIYKWSPTTSTGYASDFGNWISGNETMILGKGYIVRGPNSYTTAFQNYTANFIGVPNNGIINATISRSTYNGGPYAGPTSTPVTADDDNWNLVGNPYPSAIDALSFMSTNTNIAGFVKIWTHGTLPVSSVEPFYQSFQYNYTTADYVTYNNLGASSSPLFTGKIGAGQGFFVRMNHTTAATTENVVFNNTMRSNTHRNDQFFRNETQSTDEIERNRIWIDLVAPNTTNIRTLVGYAAGATNQIDRLFDAPALDVKTTFEIFSTNEFERLSIQGRALPFDNNDQIPLGITIPENGIYTIAIAAVDGLFTNTSQNIYLEDLTLGITHDLRAAPYSFTGTTGTNDTRFILKFNGTLGNEDFDTNNTVNIFTNESININSFNQNMKSVRIHDLLGRQLGMYNNVNNSTFSSTNIMKTQSALLVEVTLENGSVKTFKVIF
ncbi:hypothetical protein GFJ94_10735 [Flavobacterium sp. LMO8]|uniref:beta strand repeat-containing protein n=1 Tax=Flavobacterium sp. LMO8 TaxID=2654244 RepID=UPI001290E8E2|nr:GEVED domain-containing protein [Flavobacterium sp. LMO8]MQP25540.1 hypothetical protein [Flavobacterium sp. LMO8]